MYMIYKNVDKKFNNKCGHWDNYKEYKGINENWH